LNNKKYKHWEESLESSLLWISADAGCGKSVLTTFLIDIHEKRKREKATIVCYFFFKNDNDEQKSSTYALCAILHQIYTSQPELLKHASLQLARKGPTVTKQFDTLWTIFKATVEDSDANNIICLIDGLDECEKLSGNKLMMSLANYFRSGQDHLTAGSFLKVIITSRPDNSIKAAFQNLADIRLRGEDETVAISHDVELVVRAGISKMRGSGPPKELLADLQNKLIKGADRTFL
jgi:protein SERAC1